MDIQCVHTTQQEQNILYVPYRAHACSTIHCILHTSKEVQVQQDDQSTRDTPDAVYAVVDKSKKKKQEKTQGGASATTTQEADTEEQHYEWSNVMGQDWLGNVVAEHGEVGQESLSNDAWETVPQSEPCNPGAVCVVVDKSKEENKEKKSSDPV